MTQEPLRNRLMFALAYDAALRREELCALDLRDVDPAHRITRELEKRIPCAPKCAR